MIPISRSRLRAFFCSLGLGVALGACATPAADVQSETAAVGWKGDSLRSEPTEVEQGRAIAERNCASCHAIDRKSASPRPGAPPLRDVLALYEADNLAYRFIEGMRVGHDDMPHFDFDVRAANSLIAYIGTISAASD